MDGTYIDSFDTASSGNVNPAGITQDGTYFWIVDITGREVYKYLMDGTYTGKHFDTGVSGNRQPRAITQDGTYFWITDIGYPGGVYKYSMDGTYLDSWGTVEYPVRPYNSYPWGITVARNYIWVADSSAQRVFRYSEDGVFIDHLNISVGKRPWARGITAYGKYLWVTNTFDDVVYMYEMLGESNGGNGVSNPPSITTSFVESATTIISFFTIGYLLGVTLIIKTEGKKTWQKGWDVLRFTIGLVVVLVVILGFVQLFTVLGY